MKNYRVENNKLILTVPVKKITKDTKKELEKRIKKYPIEVEPVEIRTQAQNALIHLLLEQYAFELGSTLFEMKRDLKILFSEAYGMEDFETSKADIKTANLFISFIIDHALNNNINLYIYNKREKIFQNILEIDEVAHRYVIACLKSKKCAICNDTADLEHWDNVSQVGGYKFDTGLEGRFISLCRIHHGEKHHLGRTDFKRKYHIQGIFLNEKLVIELREIYKNHFKAFKEGQNAAEENNR